MVADKHRKKTEKRTEKKLNKDVSAIELKLKFCQKNVTFSKHFVKPTNTIRPENTRQLINIKILSTIVIDNVRFIRVK